MFSPIPEILDELRQGRMIVLTDDEDRENEGDLVLPAQFVTPEAITFMLSVARGYLCLSLAEDDCDRLDLNPQASVNTSVRGTAFTISIDGHPKHGFTTGVSAKERARCVAMAIDPTFTQDDFVRPGHINPLRSRNGGVLVRTGQTEGSVDLARLAGLHPSAMIIEVMRDDGEMARVPDLIKLCAQHKLKMCSVAQIIEHRLARESLVRRIDPISGTKIHTRLGEFTIYAFESIVDPLPHVALCVGGIGELDPLGSVIHHPEPTLVRMHRRNLLGDLFLDMSSSPVGPTADALHESMRMVQKAGRGAVVYLRSDGSHTGDALNMVLHTARHQRAIAKGSDTPDLAAASRATTTTATSTSSPDQNAPLPSHMRDLGIGCQILRQLGLSKLNLITNGQVDIPGLEAFGLEITQRIPITPSSLPSNKS